MVGDRAHGRVIASLPGRDTGTSPVVLLRPGGSAYFSIGQLLNPDYPGQPCPAASTLVVTPPHQGQALTIPTTLAPAAGGCGEPSSAPRPSGLSCGRAHGREKGSS
ncbi:MAG: DUF4232 domain-containing protein [Nitrososphaera sp.]|nr:DUF4232 domain-containing protein [Nitrososphaera sp.]